MRRILWVLLVIALIALPFVIKFGWEYHVASRCMKENSDALAMKNEIAEKLEAYQTKNGTYPESLTALSFTDVAAQPESLADLKRFRYRRTQSGYSISYEGRYGCFFTGGH